MMDLLKALTDIEKRFGKGSIMRFNQEAFGDVEPISTSCLSLDKALGIGGVPKGRITEIYGPESAGKTTLALHIVAEAQKEGGMAAYIDAEHALDPKYAQKLGVNLENLLISQPDCGEQGLEIAENLVRTGQLAIVVIDSVAALVPQAELNGEIGDASVGLQARLMSQAMRKLTPVLSVGNTCVIFINQLREKIGVMWGSPEVTTGGKALKFYASVRMDIRRIGAIKDGEEIIGNRTKVKIVKNKVASPFKEVEFDIIFGEGISKENDLLEIAIEKGIIEQNGSWFAYGDKKLGQGKENIRKKLKDEPKFYAELLEKTK